MELWNISLTITCADSTTTFTITFNQGGATDFARAFFRLTEGTYKYKTIIIMYLFLSICRPASYEDHSERTNSNKRREKDKIAIVEVSVDSRSIIILEKSYLSNFAQ